MSIGGNDFISGAVDKIVKSDETPNILLPKNKNGWVGELLSVWNSDYKPMMAASSGSEPLAGTLEQPEQQSIPQETDNTPEGVSGGNSVREINMSGNGEAVIDSLQQNYGRNYNVTQNLFAGTAADLNKYLEGTKLAGQGEALLNAQKKYGVNALFLMGIIQTESGYGAAQARDRAGIKPYNVAGLKRAGGGYQNNSK